MKIVVQRVLSGSSELDVLPGVGLVTAEEDAECLFCNEKFSQNSQGELWVMCLMCSLWAHVECAGAEKDTYICDYCRT